MKILLLVALMVTAPVVQANEVAYVPLELCAHQPYKSYRDYWDQTGKFCANGGTYDMTDLGEIKLRNKGEWVNSEYAAALTPENQKVVAQYETYFVRYFSTRPTSSGKVEFAVHVFFKWGIGTQTIFVFGELDGDDVKITGYSNSKALEGNLRAAQDTVKNLLSVFNGKNPNREGVNQTKAEDRERVRPVGDVIRKYRSQSTVPVLRP
jgi:hypothetical protein